MKRIIRFFLRKLIGAREKENIRDCLQRKRYHFLKRLNKKSFSKNEFKKILSELGLRNGDVVIVHSAWRAFIGFDGTPIDAINAIKEIIGEDGTILMPAYGRNRKKLVYSEPTTAGVIAEEFRKNFATERSLNSYFSMSAWGINAKKLTKDHINSSYYFDEKSPYWKAIDANAKILLLGLGKNPYKISLFHCVAYKLRDKVPAYRYIYSNKVKTFVTDKNGKTHTNTIVDKKETIKNNNRKFKSLFKRTISEENYRKINYLDIYLVKSKELFSKAEEAIVKNNINIYKTKK